MPGTALRNHTLSEAQLNLSALPDIPNPSTPYAANYVHNTGLIRLAGGQSRLLFNHAPWQVTATCVNVSPGVWDAQTSLRNTGAARSGGDRIQQLRGVGDEHAGRGRDDPRRL